MSYANPETVKEAANLLDKLYYDWFDKINLHTLNMMDSKTCILGQLYGDWDEGARTLFGVDGRNAGNVWVSHKNEWAEQIKSRRTKDWNWARLCLKQGKKVRRAKWGVGVYLRLDGDAIKREETQRNATLLMSSYEANDWELFSEQPKCKDVKIGQKFQFVVDVQNGHKALYQKADGGYIEVINCLGESSLRILGHEFNLSQNDEVIIHQSEKE